MAAVSGYGSVLTPMKLFAPALRSIPADSSSYNVVLEEGLHEYQKRCFHATAQLQQARRRQQTSRPGDAGSRSSSWLSWIPILGGDAEAEELADLEMAVEAMNDEYERRKYEQVT